MEKGLFCDPSADGIIDTMQSLAVPGVFALLILRTQEGEVILQPIGGEKGSASISGTVEVLCKRYPGCKMRLLERNYSDWRRYFEGIISREQLL